MLRRITEPCTDGRRHKWRSCPPNQGTCYKCGQKYKEVVKYEERKMDKPLPPITTEFPKPKDTPSPEARDE